MLSPFTLATGLSDHTLAVRYALLDNHTHAFGFYFLIFAILGIACMLILQSGLKFVDHHESLMAGLLYTTLGSIIVACAFGAACLYDSDDNNSFGTAYHYRTELQARQRLPIERSRLSRQQRCFHRRSQPSYHYVLEYRQLSRTRKNIRYNRRHINFIKPKPFHPLCGKLPYPHHNF